MRIIWLCAALLLIGYTPSTEGARKGPRQARLMVEKAPIKSSTSMALTVGATMGVGGGASMPGIGVGLEGQLAPGAPLLLGMDLDTLFVSADNDFGLAALPLPKVVIQVPTSADFTPFFALSVGPSFFFGERTVVNFAMFFRPGISVKMTEDIDISIDGRLGIISDSFVLLPQMAARFML